MKKILLALTFIAFIVLGCSSKGSDVKETAKGFIEAIYGGDADEAVSYLYIPEKMREKKNSEEMVKSKITMAVLANAEKVEKHDGVKSIEVQNVEKQDEKFARVKVLVTFGDKSTNSEWVSLRKDDGSWKVRLK